MAYNSSGIGSDANIPLTGWTTNAPPTGFASGGGGIGGDWRFPSQNADPRTLPAPVIQPRVLRAPAAATPASGQPDYSIFDSVDPRQNPTGPSGPMPSTQVQGNPFFNFLSALFGHSGGSPQQGMTGLLARGQGAPGTNTLGNPFNRFG